MGKGNDGRVLKSRAKGEGVAERLLICVRWEKRCWKRMVTKQNEYADWWRKYLSMVKI